MREAGATRKAPYLIILKAGPTHKISDQVEFLAQTLSERLSGEVWTFGPARIEVKVGNFLVKCDKAAEAGALSKLLYMGRRIVQGVRTVRRVRREDGAAVLISYDPLREGLIAYAIHALSGARFIVEINNAYGCRKNVIDLGTGWRATLKFSIMKAVASFVIARANGVRLMYKEQLVGLSVDVPSEKILYSFDAVPLDRFVDLGSEKTVLFVGYPFLRKGVDLLLTAFEGLQDEFPDWELVIVGHEMPEKVAERRPKIRRLSVLRGMPNVEIVKWFGRAGIFVLPSRSEGIPRVLIEAAAARRPRIATDVDGTYTVLHDGKDGMLIPPEDVVALQGALRRLMGSEALRDEFGEAARRMVHEHFSPAAYSAAVTGFVEKICGQY